MLLQYNEAIKDAHKALECDKKCKEAYSCLVECLIIMGNFPTAEDVIEQFRDIYPKSRKISKYSEDCKELKALDTLVKLCYAQNEFQNVLIYLEKAMNIASASKLYKTLKVKCENLLHLKDYYKILEVPEHCTLDDLKSAYRKQAIMYHPDKNSRIPEQIRKLHENRFKLVKKAFDFLVETKSV